ncbi:DMT family transporter [Vagococcus xieshaowenii]|uniref:QacE family quaternary ammonium compound efflux SMR transporter n=1 Tax=Vagococcus xieshaowenii TaxID=2562451 RepID=A0A4Z0DD08_9ENTE|nr:SMR family transporter [Vagococcus xieshaowenii]QCA28419.1 QacE family quaternary ammonium compound efflux SMR transporter [Vagococcus xieshaowenii]TFZ42825.1 QacE family quaternary ammonium compound efflux SMR transporter [Vagococcus xieshaowenii]
MNKNWLMILVAGIVEVGWVIGLKHSSNLLEHLLTIIAIFMSFYLLIKASQQLAVGTAYAVFVGIGTTGTILMDTLLFGSSLSVIKVLLIVLLLVGVMGLKVLSDHSEGGH